MQIVVDLLHPEPCNGPLVRIIRHQRRKWKRLVEVLDDDCGFYDHLAIMDERRDDRIWVDLAVFRPQLVAALLQLDPLSAQSMAYFRIGGLEIGGLGMLYVISGRLNANGFIFASMIDRPLVPPIMALLWSLGIVPGTLAIAISTFDFGTFLWTFFAWRAGLQERAGGMR